MSVVCHFFFFFFSSRRRHTRSKRDWSSDVCSSDLIVREASLEVRGPVIYATAVVVAVFLPELFTTSVQGRFVGPLALAFIFAVLASLVVAMTSTPALCALLLRRHEERPEAEWLQRSEEHTSELQSRFDL